jgi:hypothetical protein
MWMFVVTKGLINAINYINIMNTHAFKNSQFSPAVRDNKSLVCVCVYVLICTPTHRQSISTFFPSFSVNGVHFCIQILCVHAHR